MNYDLVFNSNLPPAVLYRRVKQCFINSEDIAFWPTDLERVTTQGSFRPGNHFITQIKLPMWPMRSFRYLITQVDDSKRTFSYQSTPEHPFQGGALVKIEPTSSGSRWIWKGCYGGGSVRDQIFFRIFGALFMQRLRKAF